MKQRLSLADAAKRLGLSTNAVRARAQKSPAEYGLERDNAGKLWVNIDPHKHASKKPSKASKLEPSLEVTTRAALEVEIDGLKQLVEAERRRADAAEREAGHWRELAFKPWWKRLVG